MLCCKFKKFEILNAALCIPIGVRVVYIRKLVSEWIRIEFEILKRQGTLKIEARRRICLNR